MAQEIPLSKLVGMDYKSIHASDRFDLFYDWFCSDEALKSKSKRLMGTVRALVATKTKMFNPDETYAFFSNNCPGQGGLYDDIRICDLKSGDVLYNVCPRNPWYGGRPTVSFTASDGTDRWENPLTFDSMKDVRAWFKNQSAFEIADGGETECGEKLTVCRRKAK